MRARWIALAVAAVAVAVAAQPAAATSRDRVTAAAVMRTLDRLSGARAQIEARLAAAQAHLQALRSTELQLAQRLGADREALAGAREVLARAVVSQYKTGSPNTAVVMLTAGSFSQALDRVEAIDRISGAEAAAMDTMSADIRRVREDSDAIGRRLADVQTAVDDLSAQRATLDAAIAQRSTLLGSLNARIARSVAAESKRRGRLRRQDGGSGGVPALPSFYGDVTWYGPGFAGQPTASGEIFDPSKLTAASPWLPFGTTLRVTSTVTHRSVVVRVNDRGPFGRGVLDLTAHAAQVIGLSGWQRCRLVILS